jgi:suppressor of fused protein SUFU
VDPDIDAPGWDAIDAAIAPLVGDITPIHWGTGSGLPDQAGLWGVSAYARTGHWFFISYGVSELFQKVTDEPSVSGWGEELTMRIARTGDESAPEWAAKLLARLGELVFIRSTPFLPGGRMEIPNREGNVPQGLAWAEDPELEGIITPFGSVDFVTTVGVSMQTIEAMRATSTRDVLDQIRERNPLLITGGPGLA